MWYPPLIHCLTVERLLAVVSFGTCHATRGHTHTCMRAHTRTQTHARTHARTHAHTNTHRCGSVPKDSTTHLCVCVCVRVSAGEACCCVFPVLFVGLI